MQKCNQVWNLNKNKLFFNCFVKLITAPLCSKLFSKPNCDMLNQPSLALPLYLIVTCPPPYLIVFKNWKTLSGKCVPKLREHSYRSKKQCVGNHITTTSLNNILTVMLKLFKNYKIVLLEQNQCVGVYFPSYYNIENQQKIQSNIPTTTKEPLCSTLFVIDAKIAKFFC